MEPVRVRDVPGARERDAAGTAAGVLAERLAALRGTLTGFLEELVHEPVVAHRLEQGDAPAAGDNPVSVDAGTVVTRRVAVLRGQHSRRPFVDTATVLVGSRLPAEFRRTLAETDAPIGRVLSRTGLEVTRVALPAPGLREWRRHPMFAAHHLHARHYRLDIAGVPVMEIAEWFRPELAEYLVAGTGSPS